MGREARGLTRSTNSEVPVRHVCARRAYAHAHDVC